MAYWISDRRDGNVKSFCCDTMEDVEKLPTRLRRGFEQPGEDPVNADTTAMGSDATVIESGAVFFLNFDDDKWVKDQNPIRMKQ